MYAQLTKTKLMIENTKLNIVTNGSLNYYKQCIAKLLCNPSSIDCNMRNFKYCQEETVYVKFYKTLLVNTSLNEFNSASQCQLTDVIWKSSRKLEKILKIYSIVRSPLWFGMTSIPKTKSIP